MSRRVAIAIVVCGAVAVLVGGALWALPELVRRVAVGKIAALTGRATSIARVELNLFTGRFAVHQFTMARRTADRPGAFVEFDRLDGRLALSALLGFDVRLAELRLVRPAIRATRTGPVDFDFEDLRALFTTPVGEEPKPGRFTYSVGRLEVSDGAIVLDDVVVTPRVEWRLDDLRIEASGFSTKPGQAAAPLRLTGRVNDAPIEVSTTILLSPVMLTVDLRLSEFDLTRVLPYLPPEVAAVPGSGKLSAALHMDRVRTGEALAQSTLSGEVTLRDFSALRRDAPDRFLELGRLRVAITQMDMLARELAIGAIELEGLDAKVVRDSRGDIDLVALFRPPPPSADRAPVDASAPSSAQPGAEPPASPRGPPPERPRPRVRVERISLMSGAITITDQAVSPSLEWKIEDLTLEAGGLSTVSEDPAGTMKARARVVGGAGSAQAATFAADADSVRLTPLALSARVAIDGVALAALLPYWPESVPAVAREGTAGLDLTVGFAQGDDGQLARAIASGSARLKALHVLQRGHPAPFLEIPALTVAVKQVDVVARTVEIGTVQIDGASVRAIRDRDGLVDLEGLAPAPEAALAVMKLRTEGASEPAPPPPAPAGGQWRLRLDRFAFAKGTLTFEDRAVSPATALTLSDVAFSVERLGWPFTRPATFAFAVTMPGGGRTDGKGTATLEPLNLQVTLSTRDTPIEPYQAYFPFEARFLGFFSGDSVSEIQRGPKGELIIASRGTAWASNLEVRAPGVQDAVARMDAMVIRDIDFSWPNYALVNRIVLTHPQIRVERDAEGAINLRTLFSPRPPEGEAATPAPPAAGDGESSHRDNAPEAGSGGPMQTMVIDLKEIEVENGLGRFIDHTTTPPFAEDISRLALRIQGLSNVFGRAERTTMTAQAVVGSEGALDMRGDLSGLGETLKADLVVELRDFALSTANPYADQLTSWTVQRGKLQAKIHYHVEEDRITAQHDLDFQKLQVRKSPRDSDRAKQRIGVPLGLVVALLKDTNGDIDFSLPLSGRLSDRNFDWGETIWAGVKQVIAKVLLSPFRAVGRLLKGGDDSIDDLKMDPVTFAAGSAVIAPSLEPQLGRVAEFLGRSPQVKLSLAPVVTAADIEALKAQEIGARVEALRREQRLPDLAAAFRVYFQQVVPDVPLPPTMEEQLAVLVPREPVPEARLNELVQRRIEATRDSLVKERGIPDARVEAPPPTPAAPPPAEGQGRVELTIAPIEG